MTTVARVPLGSGGTLAVYRDEAGPCILIFERTPPIEFCRVTVAEIDEVARVVREASRG